MKPRAIALDAPLPGFQIAPMIDVVFVIMLFFLVMAATMRVEREISIQMPGPGWIDPKVRFPDAEVTIGVQEDGVVTLNDEAFDTPAQKNLPELTRTLKRLALQRQKTLVTIQAEEQAGYERVMDVLNALHVAGLANVTFTVAP
ncbi:MAG: biopolymer transporter ExbD [Verrucomicrobiaceae bacterium]|nr:biopolymer transporter ExbD [Verrucomicrobiaceae bacterium]